MGSVPVDLVRAVQDIEQAGKRGASQAIRDYLRLVREHRIRDSQNIAIYGAQLLRDHSKQLKDEELWLVHEQVALAALDVRANNLARSVIDAIRKHYGPKSMRAERLSGMYFEAAGKFEEAGQIYARLLEEHPLDQIIWKRQVALEKSKGNLPAAIDQLKKYLECYATDRDAWEELAELYLQVQAYQQAAFCYEELIAHAPACMAYYLQLADTLYTLCNAGCSMPHVMPGPPGANLRSALRHYAAALQLSEGSNLRALHGICSCQAMLAGVKGARPSSEDAELAGLAAEKLAQLYAAKAPGKAPFVKSLLNAQGLRTR